MYWSVSLMWLSIYSMTVKHKILSIVVVAFMAIAVTSLTPGCFLLPKTPTGQVDPVAVDKAASVIKAVVADGVILACSKDKNAASYFNLAKAVLDTLIGGQDYTPATLSAALQGVPVKELKGVEARIAINTVTGLYGAFYADYVTGKVAGNAAALQLITAARDGIANGLPK
jgi:hypothetical protein